MEQKISLKSSRLTHIDLIETVAIFFVVSYHATKYSFDFLNSGSVVDYLLYFFRTILSACVPLFFFANGYLLLNKSFDLKKHIKKILRLLVIVFVWSFLLMTLYLLIAGESLTLHNIIVPILNMEVRWGMNLFWYIGALICIYILFPLLKLAFDKDKKAFYFFIIICALMTFGYKFINEIVLLLSPFTNAFENGIDLPVVTMFNPFRGSYGYSFVYFCIGGIIGENKEKVLSISKKKRNIISIFGILVSCICLFVIGVLHSRYIKNELATRMETRLPWRPTRGSLTSPSYLVRDRTLGPPLENNPEIPPSSRAEGLRLLHGLETNLATSLQTPQEA